MRDADPLRPKSELQRILSLQPTLYEANGYYTRMLALRHDTPPLHAAQEQFLTACAHAAEEHFGLSSTLGHAGGPGVVGVMSCGAGKALALQIAPLILGSTRPLLLTQANLIPQMRDEVDRWSKHYPLADPEMLSYGKLSHYQYRDVLDAIQPDWILCDEAHKIGNGSARYKRLMRYLTAHPECRLVAVSGTMRQQSLHVTAAIMRLALRQWSPLPTGGLLDQWAAVMDTDGEPDRVAMTSVDRVIRHTRVPRAADHRLTARRAFKHLLDHCPGVVVSSNRLDVDAGLRLRRSDPLTPDALSALAAKWVLPDGTLLADSSEVASKRATMRLGFWYQYIPETVHEEWQSARRAWTHYTQQRVADGDCDSPYEVMQRVESGQYRDGAARLQRWLRAKVLYPEPERRTVWLPGGKAAIRQIVDRWTATTRGHNIVVWYRSVGVLEALDRPGWTVVRSGDEIPSGGAPLVLSDSFRQGWHGVAYSRALILQPSPSAAEIEQILSRQHRNPQHKDVEVTLLAEPQDITRIARDARARAEDSGPQRFLIARWLDADAPAK